MAGAKSKINQKIVSHELREVDAEDIICMKTRTPKKFVHSVPHSSYEDPNAEEICSFGTS
jgi:hypothetical protein